uniref:Uncharacterized protein n=1 Tax=Strigamia maritima TaxID=126957 RepID=T1IR24_STRMM
MLRVKHRRFSNFRTPKAPTLSILGKNITYYQQRLSRSSSQTQDLNGHFYSTIWKLMPKNDPDVNVGQCLRTQQTLFDLRNHKLIDNHRYRLVYFYLYFTCQTHAITLLWRQLSYKDLTNVFDWFHAIYLTKKVNMFCFGGGSGCEIVGFYQYLKSFEIDAVFHCNIIDPYDWYNETDSLFPSIDPNLSIPTYYKFGFFQIHPYFYVKNRALNELHNADVITVGSYLSSFNAISSEVLLHFKFLLDHMKSSAMLFFFDKAELGFLEAMRGIAESAGLMKIDEVEDVTFSVPEHEEEAMKAHHFPIYPRTQFRACAGLWQKL